jgi:hypothetical protein
MPASPPIDPERRFWLASASLVGGVGMAGIAITPVTASLGRMATRRRPAANHHRAIRIERHCRRHLADRDRQRPGLHLKAIS